MNFSVFVKVPYAPATLEIAPGSGIWWFMMPGTEIGYGYEHVVRGGKVEIPGVGEVPSAALGEALVWWDTQQMQMTHPATTC